MLKEIINIILITVRKVNAILWKLVVSHVIHFGMNFILFASLNVTESAN